MLDNVGRSQTELPEMLVLMRVDAVDVVFGCAPLPRSLEFLAAGPASLKPFNTERCKQDILW
jgi:hypothetical protein